MNATSRLLIGILGLCVVVLGGAVAKLATRTPSDREVIDRFTVMWSESEKTWKKNTWLGILTQQNPFDVWVTQEIIFEVKPDVIVETGTHYGGSAALWSTILEQVNPRGRVITVDVANRTKKARRIPVVKRHVVFLRGSSTSPEIVGEIRRRVAGKRVMVILDSLHSRDHVLAEMRAYAPMVSVGSYLIVQDGHVNGHPVFPNWGPGPTEAIEEFLAENHQFVPDTSRERLLMTYNPSGFLRRVN